MRFNSADTTAGTTAQTFDTNQSFTTASATGPLRVAAYDGGINFTTASSDQFVITGNQVFNSSTNGINLTGGDWSLSDMGGLRNALMEIFKKVPKNLIKSEDDKKMVKAKEKSEKLLKSWLSPKEYQGLLNEGQIEVPSEFDQDTIFIIKRDPNEMVQVMKKGEYAHKLCAVAENLEMPVGDQLLSKLLLLKTDEKKFKEIAIQH